MVAVLRALLFFAAFPALAQDLLVEAELSPAEVYVQSQAVYRLRFLHAIDVRDVQLSGPSARLADLRTIGPERVYEARRGEKHYRVHERSYAVFPIASGKLELSGAHAAGHTAQGHPVRLDAPARTMTVLPADIGADGAPWLPASALTLTEEWKTMEDGVYRRTIRIEAEGVEAAQLPEPAVTADGMGVLPGPPLLQNRFAGERNIAVREQTFIMMPVRGGLSKVPELQIRWWRTDTRSAALATLPARTLYLGEAASSPDAAQPGSRLVPAAFGHLGFVAVAVSILLLVLAFLRSDRLVRAWQLQRACRAGDLHAVRDGLLDWIATIWTDPPATLGGLAGRIRDNAVADSVRALERSLYGPDRSPWNPAALAKLVAGVKRDARRNKSLSR